MDAIQSGLDVISVLNTVASLVPYAGAMQPVLTGAQELLERVQVGRPLSVM